MFYCSKLLRNFLLKSCWPVLISFKAVRIAPSTNAARVKCYDEGHSCVTYTDVSPSCAVYLCSVRGLEHSVHTGEFFSSSSLHLMPLQQHNAFQFCKAPHTHYKICQWFVEVTMPVMPPYVNDMCWYLSSTASCAIFWRHKACRYLLDISLS